MTLHLDRLLSYGDAAELVGRGPRTIRRWVRQGKLRAGGLGRSRWIRESDLMRALGFDAEPNISGPGHAKKDDA
ncbi:helix-turn-helix domain-containing protein [Falsiroseomonas sp.]|uniref:helix-turn-helix domain-containing protein n=1 Tax=Falsiroseomonas sp. TaxID=2870721 RepID=UPI002721B71D|nr:helix-turn-helix domain-containing protein [Falsiroseomonas sp.]MDO9498487.1 helix-turn-helix domain-containing protein [Falsiroseomonas sp.]